MTQEIKVERQLLIPYLNVDTVAALKLEVMDGATAYDKKLKALEILGIEVPKGTSAYALSDVWGEYIHRINDLEFTKPFNPIIVDAIRSNVELYKFFFFLT